MKDPVIKKARPRKAPEDLEQNPWELAGRFRSSDAWKNELWYEGPGQIYTEDEIAEDDAKYRATQAEHVALAKADGFIRYPVFAHDLGGELQEFEAWVHPTFEPSCAEGFQERHELTTNFYIPSYKRAGTAGTMKMLDEFGVENYYIVIDADQYPSYKEHYPQRRLIIRDIEFRRRDMLEAHSALAHPMTMAGHAPLCNFILSFSRSMGEAYYSFCDDDFLGLAMKAHIPERLYNPQKEKYNKNNFYRCSKLKAEYGFSFKRFWSNIERIAREARNPGFVGLEKFGTVFSLPMTYRTATRVYSMYVTDNRTQIYHSGRQNNDVNTSIDLTKHGLVNVLQEGICYNSEPTQKGSGGQANMYRKIGTLDKGKVIARSQPNCMKIVDRYSRIHHLGDFNIFRGLRIVGAPVEAKDYPVYR